jgi:hypothetical protein
MLHHMSDPRLEAADISTQPAALGRLFSEARGRVTTLGARACAVELEQTVCYTCTDWHTCLVFVTEAGVRLPLCDACLPFVVERAAEARTLAS